MTGTRPIAGRDPHARASRGLQAAPWHVFSSETRGGAVLTTTMCRKEQMLELCARIGFTPPESVQH